MKKKKIILLGILIVLFVINTLLVKSNQIKLLDDAIYDLVFGLRNSFFDIFFTTITKLGNTTTIIILGVILLIILPKKEKWQMTTSILSTAGINYIIKNIIQRPRPNHLRLIKQGGYSYPSGHTMISIAVYGLLLYYIQTKVENKTEKWIISIILGTIILLIGISRIYVGVHYPSDIIGGYILSLIIQWIIINVFNKQVGGKSSDKNDCK